MTKHVLLVTIGFSPNVGGIETHFDDLVTGLNKNKWKVTILTYLPLTNTKSAKVIEKHNLVTIYRLPLIRGLFYKLVHSPILEFMYLTPGLFLGLPLVLLLKGQDISVIHSHGLIAGFVSVFWGKIFNKKVITTTHSIYAFPKTGIYRKFAKWIFGNSNKVLCLSDQSVKEIAQLGVSRAKITRFVYWIDTNAFRPVPGARQKLKLGKQFIVLFVGRLVPEKGVLELLTSVKTWPKNTLALVAGIGPLSDRVKAFERENPTRLKYLGKVDQADLPRYYSAADVLIAPSTHEEGFGRVILESLACGTPVIGANRGAIPEAMDETVGKLINVSPKNITLAIKLLLNNKNRLKKMNESARPFALKHYAEKNIETIFNSYDA